MPEETKPQVRSSIETVSDMMSALEQEIQDIKNGTLDESKARVVSRFRGHQLKTAELQLQYARMHKGRIPDPEMRLIGKEAK